MIDARCHKQEIQIGGSYNDAIKRAVSTLV